MKSITLKPELNELYTLNEFILDKIPQENLQVNLMIEEAFVNIVEYSQTEFIIVNAKYESPTLIVEFIDNGIEFNPLLKEDPKAPDSIENAQIGGIGIFLTKKIADNIEYRYIDGENHLKIYKNVE